MFGITECKYVKNILFVYSHKTQLNIKLNKNNYSLPTDHT